MVSLVPLVGHPSFLCLRILLEALHSARCPILKLPTLHLVAA